jgi:hypothetical protein
VTTKIPSKKVKGEAKLAKPLFPNWEKTAFSIPIKEDGMRNSILSKNPYVVLKYFQSDWECFSDWEKGELSQFSNFLNLLKQHTWDSVYKSGGKGKNKGSLGYTPYNVRDMKSGKSYMEKIQQNLSEDISFFELRVNQKIRVHGFQVQSAFFLILLDREHRVFME